MVDLNSTNAAHLLKELYPDFDPMQLAGRKRVWLQKVEKVNDFYGGDLGMRIPVDYEYMAGRSATMIIAQAAANPTAGVGFSLKRRRDYAIGTLDDEAVEASANVRGAFTDLFKREVNSATKAIMRSASHALYGDGNGAIGRMDASAPAGSSFTLDNPYDSMRFGKNMQITFDNDADGSSLKDAGDFLIVDKVNRVTGVITTTAALAGIAGIAAQDYVFARGDENAKKIQGLAAWIPFAEPGAADSFLGVNRSVDPTRLAGWRLDEAGNGVYENLLKLGQLIGTEGADPDIALMHPLKFGELVKEIGPQQMGDQQAPDAKIGKRGIKVWIADGEITVYPDPDCPYNRGYILSSGSWVLHHLKEFPHIIKTDGNESLRQAASDGTEFRMRYWANLACVAPGHNGVCAL